MRTVVVRFPESTGFKQHLADRGVTKFPDPLTFPFAFGKVDMSFVVIDVSADWGHMSRICFVCIFHVYGLREVFPLVLTEQSRTNCCELACQQATQTILESHRVRVPESGIPDSVRADVLMANPSGFP